MMMKLRHCNIQNHFNASIKYANVFYFHISNTDYVGFSGNALISRGAVTLAKTYLIECRLIQNTKTQAQI